MIIFTLFSIRSALGAQTHEISDLDSKNLNKNTIDSNDTRPLVPVNYQTEKMPDNESSADNSIPNNMQLTSDEDPNIIVD